MKSISTSTLIAVLILFSSRANSQPSNKNLLQKNQQFTGAQAKEAQYKVIYQLDSDDPKIISKTLRNISNSLKDPRLKGKLKVELIAFSGGTNAYFKDGPNKKALISLINQGVTVAQCANTLAERKIPRSQLFDFIAVVPSGNGELIIRQQQGWAVIKP